MQCGKPAAIYSPASKKAAGLASQAGNLVVTCSMKSGCSFLAEL